MQNMGGVNSGSSTGNYGAVAAPARIQSPESPKHSGYGLPCANCRSYYAADLPSCPVCHKVQRVSALEPLANFAPAEQLPNPEELEQERERFLREFNAQVVASPLPPEPMTPAMHCNREEEHISEPEPASICQGCFDRVLERVDVLEAALQMDINEAARIVYDAVWADTSDPSKTYQNAAQALIIELKRRAGIMPSFGQHQRPSN